MYEDVTPEELSQFGFDGSRFKRCGRKELHGPCPWCNDSHNRDRMCISNGMYHCRKCGKGGKLLSLLKNPPSAEEIQRLSEISAKRMAEEQARKKVEYERNIKRLNERKPWRRFHQALLNRPDILELLARDGIGLSEVKAFGLGYIEDFVYWIDDQRYVGPGIVFPIKGETRMLNLRIRLLTKKDDPKAPLMDIEGDKYRPYMSDMGATFFDATIPGMDWVVIVEGEKKAIVLWKNGIPAIGIQGCWTFLDEWIPWFKDRFRVIYLALDPDQRDLKSEKRLRDILKAKVLWLDKKPDDALNDGTLTVNGLIEELSKSHYVRR